MYVISLILCLFLAILLLCGLFCSCSERGSFLQFPGFSLRRLLLLEPGPSGAQASAVAVHEVSSCSSWALVEMGKAAHSSVLVWRIPWTEKPGGLQSVGWQRVRHDWSDWRAGTSGLWSRGSVAVEHGFGCSVACGVFPTRGSNLASTTFGRWICFSHWATREALEC